MKTRVGVFLVRWMFGGPTLAMFALMVSPLEAQRVRFPSGARAGSGGAVIAPGGGVVGPGGAVTGAPPAVTLQPPVATPFDPYALGSNYGVTTTTPGFRAPSLPPPVWTAPKIGGFSAPPPAFQGQPPVFPSQPPGVQGLPPVADPNLVPTLPGQPYPATTPGAIFPDGMFPSGRPNLGGWFGGITALEPPPYQRLFEDFYGRFTWIYGDAGPTKPDELQIEEVEVATSLVIPGSMGIAEEFRVTPGLIYDALGGPFTTAAGPPATALSLPSNLYGTYLDTYGLAQFTPQVGGELNARVGVYSDFDTFRSDSIRITGRGLFLLRLTPTLTVKGGVEYLDRNDIHLLPAGGVLWEPTPQTRFDIYFPRPKLAKYFTTVGANEIWWYVGGEYGGGAWTVRDLGVRPYTGRIDINDIRVFAGLDFTRPSNLTGFVEGGYVFEREIFYVDIAPPNVFSLKETFMLRAGLIW